MKTSDLLVELSSKILDLQTEKPLIVAINGLDGAGKTVFAKDLVKILRTKSKDILYAPIDGFHNSKEIRYEKGKDSPEGFYQDSYNYNKLKELLIQPIKNLETTCKTAYFDCGLNESIEVEDSSITKNTILIIEGIFLFRPELIDFWDLKIFLDVNFETSLARNISRSNLKKSEIEEQYFKRYIQGQKLYLNESYPKAKSDILIDNNDFENPKRIELQVQTAKSYAFWLL